MWFPVRVWLAALALSWSSLAFAVEEVPQERLIAWSQAADRLTADLAALPAVPALLDRRADVAVCAKGVEWIVRHREFHKPNYLDATDRLLAVGRQRLAELQAGRTPWLGRAGKQTVFGYVSQLDQSVQPFAVTLPKDFDPAARKRWPLHLVLHGRADTMNEVEFFRQHEDVTPKREIAWIQLDVFGRTNNAYRWAGEVDVFEALAATRRLFPIDDARITLWGFSMGGAGAWHLGLHHPDQWSSVGAGAGFAETVKYVNLPQPVAPLTVKLLRIYDATEYALNAANLPVIGYGGELDKQLAAAQTMQARAAEVGVTIPVLIGPQTAHKFHPDSEREFFAFHAAATAQGRTPLLNRRKVRFTTATPKYNSCAWVVIEQQGLPYEPSVVEAEVQDDDTLLVTTKNVGVLGLTRDIAATVRLDGEEPLPLREAAGGLLPNVYYESTAEGWRVWDYRVSHEYLTKPGRTKRRHLQGPIDDAFTRPFVCVRGTGTPWSESHEEWARGRLAKFEAEYDRFLRATPIVLPDTQVTEELLESHHLILFGDPGSNSLIARVIDRLPMVWTKTDVTLREQSYPTVNHGVAMVYPNPLNPARYVVLNSGHTFGAAEFLGSNAQLYPRLGDVAVLRFEPQPTGVMREQTLWTELFDAHWGWANSK